MSLCSICRSLLRALPRSRHHAGDNQQDPRHTDPCDDLMQHKHTGQQVSLDIFPFSHNCAEASLLDKFILAEPVASPKYLQITAPLCQRTESGKAAGQRKHGNDRAGQPQNSASHAGQTQNGQHNQHKPQGDFGPEHLCRF